MPKSDFFKWTYLDVNQQENLFCALALDYNKSIRRHRFRDRARTIVNNLPKTQRALLIAYTHGVNQGLLFLVSQPFEYLLLQQEAVQWSEEHSILTIFSIYIDLQYHDSQREQSLGLIKTILSADLYAFLNPRASIWDAAIDNNQFHPSPLPTKVWPAASGNYDQFLSTTVLHNADITGDRYQVEKFPGSNNNNNNKGVQPWQP
jgi:penicillin amidase